MSEYSSWLITFFVNGRLETVACGIKHAYLSYGEMDYYRENDVVDKIMALMPPEWMKTHQIVKTESIDLIFPRLDLEKK